MFYYLLFSISAILLFFAQKAYAKWPAVFWLLCYIDIFMLAFVAGVRDYTIGTDVKVYGLETWQTARAYLGNFLEGSGHTRREILFYTIDYLAALVSDSYAVALFLLSFIMHVLALHALKRYMDRVPLFLLMTVVSLYFYILTLNMMAQGLAAFFLLWSLKYFEDRRLVPFLMCIVISFFIHHSSAVAGFVFLCLYWILGRDESKWPKYLLAVCVASVVVVVVFVAVLKLMSSLFPVMGQFLAYGEAGGSFKSSLSFFDLMLRLALVFFVILCRMRNVVGGDKRLFYFLSFLLVVDLMAQFLGLYTFYAMRIGYFFSIVEFPLFLVFVSDLKATEGSKFVMYSSFVAYLCLYCWICYFKFGWNDAYPYTSDFLGI